VTSSLCGENDRLLREGKSEEEEKKEKEAGKSKSHVQHSHHGHHLDGRREYFQFRTDTMAREASDAAAPKSDKDDFSTGSCLTQAYDIGKSERADKQPGSAKKLVYGSAELEGYFYKDRVCPVKNRECFPLEFLAIYKAKGLHKDTDGILGLSPM